MEAVRGGHWSGDIAVDDVTIMAGNCPEVRGYCLFFVCLQNYLLHSFDCVLDAWV